MTSANGGTSAGQYPCDGWVDDLEPTPLGECASWFHLLSTTGTKCANADQCVYREISARSSDATILVACAPPLVSDKNVSEAFLIQQENRYLRYEGSTWPLKKTPGSK